METLHGGGLMTGRRRGLKIGFLTAYELFRIRLTQLYGVIRREGFSQLALFLKTELMRTTPANLRFSPNSPSFAPQFEIVKDTRQGRERPVVSIVIPCFKQAFFLGECLQSVADSFSKEHECIIIDDGNSARESAKIASQGPMANHQSLLTLKIVHNAGLPSARNLGIDFARGDFIKFLDSDDLLLSGALDREVDSARLSGSSVVISRYVICDVSGEEMDGGQENIQFLSEQALSPQDHIIGWESGLSIPIHAALFSKNDVPQWETRLKSKEDFVFWFDVLTSNLHITQLSEPGAKYRHHAGQMTRIKRRDAGAWFLEALWIIAQRKTSEPLEFRQAINSVTIRYGLSALRTFSNSAAKSKWLETMGIRLV